MDQLSELLSVSRTSFDLVWTNVVVLLPAFVTAVVVFVLGAFVATQLGKLVAQIIRVTKIDDLLAKLEFEKALERGGIKLNAGGFIGGLVKWFVIIWFLLISVSILRLDAVSDFLSQVLMFLPHVVVAAAILVIAALVANLLENTIRSGAGIAGLRGALAGVVVRWAVWIFAIVAALEQLGDAVLLLQTVITGLVAALALAFGLAFGLGGKEWAARILDETKRDMM